MHETQVTHLVKMVHVKTYAGLPVKTKKVCLEGKGHRFTEAAEVHEAFQRVKLLKVHLHDAAQLKDVAKALQLARNLTTLRVAGMNSWRVLVFICVQCCVVAFFGDI